jgi:sugar phosphate isomerase/epimerase
LRTLSRRRLFTESALGLAAARCLAQADPLGLPIGCQTYPVRESIGKDFDGTLRELSGIGFKTIEMCSPPSYKDGYAPLIGMKASELRKHIQDAGLGCDSCHYGFQELKDTADDRIAFAKELGLKQMVLSSFGLRNPGLADYARAAGEANKAAEKVHAAGLDFGYHNHDMEFKTMDGVLVYDKLMQEFDPKLVKMQFQVSVISLGYKASDFMTKYPGRFISMHLQDWSADAKKTVPIGEGVVDWKKTFEAAKSGGVKNYFVEMDLADMKASYPYLHNLKG